MKLCFSILMQWRASDLWINKYFKRNIFLNQKYTAEVFVFTFLTCKFMTARFYYYIISKFSHNLFSFKVSLFWNFYLNGNHHIVLYTRRYIYFVEVKSASFIVLLLNGFMKNYFYNFYSALTLVIFVRSGPVIFKSISLK